MSLFDKKHADKITKDKVLLELKGTLRALPHTQSPGLQSYFPQPTAQKSESHIWLQSRSLSTSGIVF